MNVSTKTWLLDLIDDRETAIKKQRQSISADEYNMAIARVNDAWKLVDQGTEEPIR